MSVGVYQTVKIDRDHLSYVNQIKNFLTFRYSPTSHPMILNEKHSTSCCLAFCSKLTVI